MTSRDGATMPKSADEVPTCLGCHGYHGSVGGELACLRLRLIEARGALADSARVFPAAKPHRVIP